MMNPTILNPASGRQPPANPFSTRAVRPGTLDYLFPAGDCVDRLLERFRAESYRGQILGPHGTGKSTLLATLQPHLAKLFDHVESITLRDSQRTLGVDLAGRVDLGLKALVVVDGYEQLGRWARWRLHRICSRRGWGLLVTTHRDVGLSTIMETSVSDLLATHLVKKLLDGRASVVDPAELSGMLSKRAGNFRDTLFDLYDRYERSRQSSGG